MYPDDKNHPRSVNFEELRRDRIEYLQAMAQQLAQLAKAERCDFAAYLLEQCYFELSDVLRGTRPYNLKDHRWLKPAGNEADRDRAAIRKVAS